MKKRIVSALLVCVLGMSLVTGCGNNAKAAETTKTADEKIQLDCLKREICACETLDRCVMINFYIELFKPQVALVWS